MTAQFFSTKSLFYYLFFFSFLLPAAAVAQSQPHLPATTFQSALMSAYVYHPELEAARAELRGVDETYPQAISGYRPRLTGEASYRSGRYDGDITDESGEDEKTVALRLLQPVYRGGSTAARVRASEEYIKAQRWSLLATEQRVLLDAVTAYMDVLRDQEVLRLARANESVLQKHLDATRTRHGLGDITKTDVSQAESRHANAVAGRAAAEGNLSASRARFERVTGTAAGELARPSFLVEAPATLEDARMIAAEKDPQILRARHALRAASKSTRAIKGEMLPLVDVNGSLGRTYDPGDRIDDRVDFATIGVLATMPLYTGGGTESRVRQSRQLETQRAKELQNAERQSRQTVIEAWSALQSAEAEIRARHGQIKAAHDALDGVRVETDYGTRTTLDMLDAEQEYLDAQVALLGAERNKVVAVHRVLAAVGELTAENLRLPLVAYDPQYNFQNVKNKWTGLGIEKMEAR